MSMSIDGDWHVTPAYHTSTLIISAASASFGHAVGAAKIGADDTEPTDHSCGAAMALLSQTDQ
jgi:hypothetical protein